jgi:hypothetical protein
MFFGEDPYMRITSEQKMSVSADSSADTDIFDFGNICYFRYWSKFRQEAMPKCKFKANQKQYFFTDIF